MQPNSAVSSFNIEATIENEAVLKHQMTNHNTYKGHVITSIEVSKEQLGYTFIWTLARYKQRVNVSYMYNEHNVQHLPQTKALLLLHETIN